MKESIAVHGVSILGGCANYFIRNESGVIDQRIGGGVRFPLPILFTQKVDNSLLRAPNNGLLPSDQNGSLKELFVLHENIDDRFWIAYEIVWIEFKFLKFGILTNEVLYRIFKDIHDPCECGLVRWCFNVKDDFMFNT